MVETKIGRRRRIPVYIDGRGESLYKKYQSSDDDDDSKIDRFQYIMLPCLIRYRLFQCYVLSSMLLFGVSLNLKMLREPRQSTISQ
jgi:hypothetical protein